MKTRVLGILFAGMCVGAYAETLVYTDSLAWRDTNWTHGTAGTDLSVPQWNQSDYGPSWSLVSITVELVAGVRADYQIENESTQEQTSYGYEQDAAVTLIGPSSSVDLTADPVVTHGRPGNDIVLTTYDNTTDYDGTSGDNYLDETAEESSSDTVASGDFGLYSGSGNVTFTTQAYGSTAEFTTGGDTTSVKQIDANALVRVTYEYIPEPSTAFLLLPTLVAVVRRRR